MALLLDLANILGGFLLAAGLLAQVPGIADGVHRARSALDPFGWVVGVVALVTSGYWILVHVTEGPRLFHFEVVGLAVGVALLWERLTGRARPGAGDPAVDGGGAGAGTVAGATLTGAALLLAILGVIAVLVGIQGLFTPDG